jgi:hypothetical protein
MVVEREELRGLLEARTVVDLPAIRQALSDVSAMTAFRHLRGVPYRRSYNHNGRYYALHDLARYDRFGLWSVGDIHFSVDGSLKNTVRRMVHEAEAGMTHHELLDRLRVRVQNTLLDLLHQREVDRERVAQVYVYLHTEAAVREAQMHNRKAQIVAMSETEVSEQIVIQVLLTLIRHPGAKPPEVVRHLRGHSPPILRAQVEVVFARYALGEKGGPSIS